MKTAVEANWAVISRGPPKLDAQTAVRHRANIAAAKKALASAEALEEQRKATVADAQAAATAAGESTARARETVHRIRAEEAKRRREEVAVEQRRATTMRPAPGATSCTAGANSAQHDASASFPPPSAALTARLGPLPRSPSAKVPVTGQTTRL